jgi:hypothetical protein
VRLKAIYFRTAGPYLALENSNGDYALIDHIEFGGYQDYHAQELETGAEPNLELISRDEWIGDRSERSTPGVRIDHSADRWVLVRDDGETFARLDASDLLALFGIRGL